LINIQSDQKLETACKEDKVNNLHVSKARKQGSREREKYLVALFILTQNIWLLKM
jgi:hypothetical protein